MARTSVERSVDRLSDVLGRVLEHLDGPPRAPARPLRRIGWGSFLLAIPGLYDQLREVPETYVTRAAGQATIACPCGARPAAAHGLSALCACGRIYLNGDVVYVVNSPQKAAA